VTDAEYLAHIESAILQIKAHTAGLSQEAYEADSKTQRAVERNLQIVGDAVHKLSKGLREAQPQIPWNDVYAARNVVVHHYFGVNQKILWDILHSDLEPLLTAVQELLARMPRDAAPE
jgi:uncharacterized protein with HEPN domain